MFEIKKYLKYALKWTHQREDSEDCIQSAFLIYTKYKDKLDTSNPEKTLMWLIKQECIRLNKQKNLQSSGKILRFEDMYLSLPQEDRQERIDSKFKRVSYNEGPLNYDKEVLQGIDLLTYLGTSSQYCTCKLTETAKKSKYGDYRMLQDKGKYLKTYKNN